MNKKLIALAVAGACVAPAAMAQTANPVTLYGRVHVTFESVEATGAGPLSRRNRVQDEASLLGVRGVEDLGGGLKAFFQLETGFKPDQNDTVFAARNSGVGLQGNWGSILLGRWDTPYKVTTTAIDPFGDVTLGGYTAAMNGSGVRGVIGQFDRREQNNVQYWSPTWAGVQVRLSYMANEGRTATLNPRSNGASLTWTGGPVYVGYAYHEFKDITFGAAPSTVFATLPKQTANQVFGTFAFGPIKLGAAYEEIKREGLGTAAVPGFSKHKAWLGNIVWTLGNNQLIYQYSQAKNGEVSVPGTIEPDCNVNALGWQYNFTRRTFFLAQYAKIENKNINSTCNFGSTPGPITTNIGGQNPKGISLGLRHIF
jgi:predicted porin